MAIRISSGCQPVTADQTVPSGSRSGFVLPSCMIQRETRAYYPNCRRRSSAERSLIETKGAIAAPGQTSSSAIASARFGSPRRDPATLLPTSSVRIDFARLTRHHSGMFGSCDPESGDRALSGAAASGVQYDPRRGLKKLRAIDVRPATRLSSPKDLVGQTDRGLRSPATIMPLDDGDLRVPFSPPSEPALGYFAALLAVT